MFKVGDKVICIDNSGGYEKYLTIGKTYEIYRITNGRATGKTHFMINIGTQILDPYSHRFTDLKGYRKLKINKLCSNQVIK